MAVIQVKKYKIIKDENGNKIQIPKSKEEWNKETKNGNATWYFYERYNLNDKRVPYKSGLFELKRTAEEHRGMFLNNPIEYISKYGKRSKRKIENTVNNNHKKLLKDYFEDFLIYYTEFTKDGSIYDSKILWNCHIAYKFANLTPDKINLAIVQEWHEEANKIINPKTNKLYATSSKNSWYSVLSAFLKYLTFKGLIEMNYAKVIGAFKEPLINKNQSKEIKYQTLEQFNLFMEVIDDDFWYTFFNFLFWHGCRKGEQRALTIKDIKSDYSTIHFHNNIARNKNGGEKITSIKNRKERIITMAEQSKIYIEKLINYYKEFNDYSDDWYLFGGPKPIGKNVIDRAFKIYYNKLIEKYPNNEINILSHHEFGRHSHASYLLNIGLEKGVPMDELLNLIAQRLGDTVEVIRETYAHSYEDKNMDKIKKILEI